MALSRAKTFAPEEDSCSAGLKNDIVTFYLSIKTVDVFGHNSSFKQWPLLCYSLITLLDELGKHFVVRLVMRLWYKDQHKTHYASGRTSLRSASFKTYFEGKFFQAHNASGVCLYT